MNQLRISAFTVGIIIGIAGALQTAITIPYQILLAAFLLGAAISIVLWRNERHWITPGIAGLLAAAALAGWAAGYARVQYMQQKDNSQSLDKIFSRMEQGEHFSLRGSICEEPDVRSQRRTDLRLRITHIKTNNLNWQPISPRRVELRVSPGGKSGQHVFNSISTINAYGFLVEATLRYHSYTPPLNPGEFDLRTLLKQNDLAESFRVSAKDITIIEQRLGNIFVALALFAKQDFLQTYRQTIRSPASRLIAAATLGMRRAVDGINYRDLEITEMFRHAGVGHVLAVSGLHVSVVTLLLFTILSALRIPPRRFTPFIIIFLLLFAVLTGARPSSVRAVIMNSVILLIYAYGGSGIGSATTMGLGLSAVFILMHRPAVLFSPGFLLSYGAVLSLAMLTAPINYWLTRLRGFMLAGLISWLIIVIYVSAWHTEIILRGETFAAGLALLIAVLWAGIKLNHCFSKAWSFGIERIPPVIRFFFCAQLAIQAGMMIPLSAWFFGRFPVAGIFVNLLAIPAVGILVQLGLLIGLVGLLPFAGIWLAVPFGAAATLIGELFLYIAWFGATVFPYPSVPKPTTYWMIYYYSFLFAILGLHHYRHKIQLFISRRKFIVKPLRLILTPYAALPLCLAAIISALPHRNKLDYAWCISDRKSPVMLLRDNRRNAIIINGGDAFTGKFRLFDILRKQGSVQVEKWILPAVLPDTGMESFPALNELFKINMLVLPFLTEPGGFFDALQDDFIKSMADKDAAWAVNYRNAYQQAVVSAHNSDTTVTSLNAMPAKQWDGLYIAEIPREHPPRGRRILYADLWNFRWIFITDSRPDDLDMLPATSCDVLYIADHSTRDSYPRLQSAALKAFNPRIVILAGTAEWLPEKTEQPRQTPHLMQTGRDGAIHVSIDKGGNLVLKAWVSKRKTILPPP